MKIVPIEFDGGARRTGRKAPHFLVPVELMKAVAWTRLEGDAKYEPGNWMQGNTEFFVDCLSHAIEHLMVAPFDDNEGFDVHMGHAATNIGFILWALRHGRVTIDDFSNAANILKPPAQKRQASGD